MFKQSRFKAQRNRLKLSCLSSQQVSVTGAYNKGNKSFFSWTKSFICKIFSLIVGNSSGDLGKVSLSEAERAGRVIFMASIVCLWSGFLSMRLYNLQSVEKIKWIQLAAKQHQTTREIQGARGTIYDANARTLAVSVETVSLGLHPRAAGEVESLADSLNSELGIKVSKTKEVLESDKSFVWLARGLPIDTEQKLEHLNLSGIETVREFKRFYPQGSLGASILGRVSRDGRGQSGIELAFDHRLSAESLSVDLRRDARGRFVADPTQGLPNFYDFGIFDLVSFDFLNVAQAAIEPNTLAHEKFASSTIREEGSDLFLSIDAYLQGVVEDEFSRAKESTKSKAIFGLVSDAETGEILALAQAPGFNPNQANLTSADFKNLAIQELFEPGSTFKPFSVAAALQAKVVQADEIMDCGRGGYRFGRHTISDVHPVGVVPLRQVLVKSSNVCTAKLGQRLGKDRLYQAIKEFGFGQATGVELAGEENGILRDKKRWADIDVLVHAFGQGISVNALQMVQAYSAIANGGLMVKPTILRANKGQVQVKRVLDQVVADQVLQMLEGVTEDEGGTGHQAAISGLHVPGKTGTAQKACKGRRGYESDKVVSSFIGVIDGYKIGVNRKLIMYVVVDEPGVTPRWGGAVAAPVFRRSMERILSHLMTPELVSKQ